jgi:hypothetical protein
MYVYINELLASDLDLRSVAGVDKTRETHARTLRHLVVAAEKATPPINQ